MYGIMIERIFAAFLECDKVSIDSREDLQGAMFFGLPGENFNGGNYTENALEKGAKYAVVNDEKFCIDSRVFLVTDVLSTLQELALMYRKTFKIPVIGITGSNGKTTTKELINLLLMEKYHTHWTKGNYNNHIGLPLTILSAPTDTEILILEMGASAVGEIDELCRIGMPTHGVITNIGPAHLKGFGSLEGVKRAKSELYRYLEVRNGTLFVNLDEDFLDKLSEGIRNKVGYSLKGQPQAQYKYELVQSFPDIIINYFDKGIYNCRTALYGEYNAKNIITAISIARFFEIPGEKIKRALGSFKPGENRSQLLKEENNTYIMDAYNANPLSMRNSINAFANMESNLPKVLVLGDMKELGPDSVKYHQEIVDLIQQQAWSQIFLVGEEFRKCNIPERIISFHSTATLSDYFSNYKLAGKFILLKGSRSMGLEKIKDILG